MIITLMIVVFVLGYMAIALEHPIKVDKAATALSYWRVITWALLALLGDQLLIKEWIDHLKDKGKTFKETPGWYDFLKYEIQHHIVDIAEILFFLLAAMTIVELIDAHQGFAIITDKITTNKKVSLIWILSVQLLSSSQLPLDNLTTAIVMATLLPKLIKDKEDIMDVCWYGNLNCKCRWSMVSYWRYHYHYALDWRDRLQLLILFTSVFLPSLVCALVPLIYLSFRLKGNVTRPEKTELKEHHINPTTPFERNLIFYLGVAGLLFVPIFKTITHLPPYT